MRIGKVQDWKETFKPLGQFMLSLGRENLQHRHNEQMPKLGKECDGV